MTKMTENKSFEITPEVIDKINAFAVEPLKAEQVYCFKVRLCDNDIDRDHERFSKKALEKLAKLYMGKTGIFDHDPKGAKQSARIFAAEVITHSDRKTAAGEPYAELMANAYMVRTDDNKSLIAEISGGIKKEVSVGCAVSKRICSICGRDAAKHPCNHIKGKRYGEKLCFYTLDEPTDAYEWSFVAVPAQRSAGVTKRYAEGSANADERLEEISKKAYEGLTRDIIRLSYFACPQKSAAEVKAMITAMDFFELYELKGRLEAQLRAAGEKKSDSYITLLQEKNEVFKA